MIGSPDGDFLWFVDSDITPWRSSLIGLFKASQHCLMIGWTSPWPQSIWLVVVCVRGGLVPQSATVSGATEFLISFIYFPRWSSFEDFCGIQTTSCFPGLSSLLFLIVFLLKFQSTEYFFVRRFLGHVQLFHWNYWLQTFGYTHKL